MMVSVLMITYNHEKFIRQALDSALMQNFDGEWELVIGEDCSTDATRSILLEYQKLYPHRIRLLLREKNLGWMKNSLGTFHACRGKYIALLEGDDLWTSPDKLQKQVDFLESHPGFSSSFHNVTVLSDDKETTCYEPGKMKREYHLKDIVGGNFIHTCSVVYRNGGEIPEWFESMPMGDWPTHILNAEWGPIGYIDEVMASYRVHGGGLWSAQSRCDILQSSIHAALVIDSHLKHQFRRMINREIAYWELETAIILATQNKRTAAIRHLAAAIAKAPLKRELYKKIVKGFIPVFLTSEQPGT